MRPLAVDLFAGCGGLSLGFEQAGFDIVAAVEQDPVHSATHLYNFPNCEMLCRDIRRLSGADVLAAAREGFRRRYPSSKWPGRIDAVIGGPPCQGFSPGGTRQLPDERNELLSEYVRIVTEIRPDVFCLENVAGLLESRFERLRAEAFGALERVGYAVTGTDRAINTIDFGLPQRRRRVIVMGGLGGHISELKDINLPAILVADALDGLPEADSYGELLLTDFAEMSVQDQIARSGTNSVYARTLAGLELDSSDLSDTRIWNSSLLTNSRRTRHLDETVKRFDSTKPGSVEPVSRFFRLALEEPARTLRAGTGTERGAHTSPRPIHPSKPRVITVREAARLHGYPDWFRFHTTNWHGHRQVGNSVPPPLARAAGRSLFDALGQEVCRTTNKVHLGSPELLRLSTLGAVPVVKALKEQLPTGRARRS